MYSHQRNLELDQTRYIVETQEHESLDLKEVKFLSKVFAFCDEDYVIMNYCFVPFHIKTSIARHVELQNVTRILMDLSQDQNRLRSMQLKTTVEEVNGGNY